MNEYRATYEHNEDGWWASVPDLPGCTSFGRTREEAERNVTEAIAAHVALLRETGRPVPAPTRAAV